MAFHVELSRRALRDLTNLYETINTEQSAPATRWFNGLEEAILALESLPRMGSVTHEDGTIHQLIYGNKPHFYRILYQIEEEEQLVRILQIRHGRRLPDARGSTSRS